MLVLTRKVDEAIQIGDDIFITVISVQGSRVRIAIEADPSIVIRRSELHASDESDNGGEAGAKASRGSD